MKRKKLNFLSLLAFLLILILGPIVYFGLLKPKSSTAAWFNDSWLYRTALTFTNTGAADSNKKVKFDIDTATLYTAGKIQIDCDDSRFTDANGNLLDYYLDSANGACNTNSTDYWVLVPTISAGSNLIYHYYGNSSATKGSQNSQFSQATFTQGATSAAAEEQSPGPVAYWKFDEGTGTIAHDSGSLGSNSGSFGSGTAAPTWQTEDMCVSGKCLKFDGTDDYVGAGDPSNDTLDMGTHDMTISAWVKPNSTSGGAIVNKRNYTGEVGYDFYFNNQTVVARIGDGSSELQTVSANSSVLLSKWSYVTAVWDRDANLTIYVNGVASGTPTNISSKSASQSNSHNFTIGDRNQTSYHMYFNGFIDDVKIFPYARSAAQIKTDYNAGKGHAGSSKGVALQAGSSNKQGDALSNGLVGYWKMDEGSWNGSANEVIDSSGNANHGVGVGSTKPTTGQGKFGNGGIITKIAYKDNYVSTNLHVSTWDSKTFAAWVYQNASPATWDMLVMDANEYHSYRYSGITPYSNKLTLWQGTTGSVPGYQLQSDTSLPTGRWVHVVGTIDKPTGTMRIYVDGVKVKESVQNMVGTPFYDTGGTVSFGGGPGGTSINGKLDDVRIYNRALSPTEVRQLYDWAPGPVAYYKFEEGTGGTVADSSGNSNTGTWSGTGTTHWTTGKFGKAGKFSSSNGDYVDAGDPASGILDFGTNNFTACAWINHAGGTAYGRVLEKGAYNSVVGWEIAKGNQDDNYDLRLGFYTDSSKTRQVASSAIYKKNTWYYVCMVVNRASTYSLYVNGVFITSGDISAIPTETVSNDRSLYISQSGGNKWNGSIDDVRIYNYARSTKQIVEDMNAGHPAVGSPVGSAVGYWKFDEGYGTNANNSGFGGSALNGTFGATTAAPAWSNDGKFGKALSFDGSNDYVAGAAPGITGDSPLSISVWVYRTQTNLASYPNILAFGNAVSEQAAALHFRTDGRFAIGTKGGTYTQSALTSINTWYHVVGTYTGSSGTWSIYVNGKLEGTQTESAPLPNFGTTRTTIGADVGTATQFFGGLIDEVKIYNYALTEDEIKLDYNRGSAMVLGTLSDTSGLSGGQVASQSASAEYCIPGDTATCNAPVGRWDFEQTSSGLGKVDDVSGNNNQGTWNGTGATHWTTGKVGKAGKFNGSDDYVGAGNGASLSGAGTIEFWLKYGGTGSSNDRLLIAKRDGTGTNYQLSISQYAGSVDQFAYYNGTSPQLYSGYVVPTNQWVHLALVRTAVNTIDFYVNGINTYTFSKDWGTTTGAAIGIGGNPAVGSYYANGLIDQVRIYNYARTPAQIAWDYNRGKPVAQYKFDECQGNIANDSSGNKNNGTITIGATGTQTQLGTCSVGVGSTAAWGNGSVGKYNASLNFDGVDDYTQITDTANLRFDANTADFSLFSWVKRATTGTEYIISKEDADNDGYRLMFNSSNQVLCSEDSTDVTSTATITDTNWHLIGCTIDRDGNGQVFIDGKTDGATVAMGTDAMATTSNIRIATRSYTSANWFNGQIDDVQIFNYALNAVQVRQLYNQGSAVRFGPITGTP